MLVAIPGDIEMSEGLFWEGLAGCMSALENDVVDGILQHQKE